MKSVVGAVHHFGDDIEEEIEPARISNPLGHFHKTATVLNSSPRSDSNGSLPVDSSPNEL
jgi:hypothetical protein